MAAHPAQLDHEPGTPELTLPMSFEEFQDWAPENRLAEWSGGTAFLMSPASILHQFVQRFLFKMLDQYVESRGLGFALCAPTMIKMAASAREPDIVVVLNENRHRLREFHIEGRVDLAVEIISAGYRLNDTVTKRAEYAAAGIPEYWIIDPYDNSHEFLTLVEGGLYEPLPITDGRVYSRTLPGLWLDPAWITADQPPTALELEARWAAGA